MAPPNPFVLPTRLDHLQIEIATTGGTGEAGRMSVDRFSVLLRHALPAALLELAARGSVLGEPGPLAMVELAARSGKFETIGLLLTSPVGPRVSFAPLRAAGLSLLSYAVDGAALAAAAAGRADPDGNELRRTLGAAAPAFATGLTLRVALVPADLDALPACFTFLAAVGARAVVLEPAPAAGFRPDDLDRLRALIAEAAPRLPSVAITLPAALRPDGSRCRRPLRDGSITVAGMLTPCRATLDPALYAGTGMLDRPYARAWLGEGPAAWLNLYLDGEPAVCRGCLHNPSGAGWTAEPPPAPGIEDALKLQREGRSEEAERLLRERAGGEQQVEALHRLGLLRYEQGDAAAALPLLQTSQELRPGGRHAHNLAWALHKLGRVDEALAMMKGVVRSDPDYIPGYHSCAALLEERGDRVGAAASLVALGLRSTRAGNFAAAEAAVRRLAALGAEHPEQADLANLLRAAGRPDLAQILLESVVAASGGDLGARLGLCMAQLRLIYASEEELAECRRRYSERLVALAARCREATPAELAAATRQIGVAKPFFLAYQGHDDTALQRVYGEVVERLGTGRPALPAPPPAGAKERLRIGFASAYFQMHSVSKLFNGWIHHLDRRRFEIFCYDLSARGHDDWSRSLAAAAERFVDGTRNVRDWAELLRRDQLDVLIYPELGMETVAVQLGCQRLAPVQCAAWGHPVTTGLRTIDYFLSSELMEPHDGDGHYTERLVRLPNLSVHYEPLPSLGGTLTRASLGLREKAPVFICCQSLFKYLPRHDVVFPRIAARVEDAQFLFIGAPRAPATPVFRQRLEAAFAAAGLDAARHVAFTPPVPPAEFPALLRAGDVYLDSIGWSGGNTTLEAITCGLPVVTLAGALMRGRHSAAMLRRMGLEQRIATEPDAYVELAIGLGASATDRAAAAGEIAERRGRLFADLEPVRALESFLDQALRRVAPAARPG